MSTQVGFRVHEWGSTPVLEEFPRPEPAPGEVLVEVEACGIGLTVLNCIRGDLSDDPALLPRVPGHELVGRVAQRGSGVTTPSEGQRVTAYFYLSCGTCTECSAGHQSRCQRLAGWVGVHRDGGYAPFAVLPAFNAVVLPDEIDPVAATVAADAVATPLHVCAQRATVRPGDRVVVTGAGGGVGAHMVQMAAAFGARVAGLDVRDDKLALIERVGALAVDSSDFAAVDAGSIFSDGPPTVVIDLVGSAASLRWASDALGTGGRMVVLTTFRDRELAVHPRELVFREASLVASRYASRAEVAEAARMVAAGRIEPIIGRRVGPDGVLAIHEQVCDGRLLGRGALVWNERTEA